MPSPSGHPTEPTRTFVFGERAPDAAPMGIPRPLGVTILAVVLGVAAILGLMASLVAFAGGAALAGGGPFGAAAALLGVFLLGYALAGGAIAFGLVKRMRWAWYAALMLAGLGLVTALMSLVSGDMLSAIVGLILNTFVLWYLLNPDVQTWFGVHITTPWRYGGRPT